MSPRASSDGIAIFSRDPTHGKLTLLAEPTATSQQTDQARTAQTPARTGATSDNINGLALSPDGKPLRREH